MAEPLGVAFIEIEPIAPNFRAKTEAQVRSQVAGSRAATTAVAGETGALERKAVAANGAAAAEERAAVATRAHGTASSHAAKEIAAEATAMGGLRGAALGVPPALAAIAVGVGLAFKSLEEADQLAEKLHAIQEATHASADEIRGARQEALALGRDLNLPLTTANDAAEAINLLARSGFDLKDSMIAARGALLLAGASGDGLEGSVREIDRVLDAFNLTAEDSVRVADAVAIGLKFTQGNAEEFAQALATVAPIADLMGLSLEETNTLVLQLAESGLSAGQAAGSLRQSLLRLATATGAQGKAIREALAGIGLGVNDILTAQGGLRPDAFVRLGEALDTVSEKQRKAILIQIFTRRAALGVLRIIDQEREGFERMGEKARESGAALDEARAKTKTFGGQTQELRDDVSDLGAKMGRLAEGPALVLVTSFRGIARQADRAATALDFMVTEVGLLAAAFDKAVPGADKYLQILIKIAELQRDPIGGAFDFLKRIPGEVKDAAAGLQQAIDQNVGGIRDIPGIEKLSQNLGLLTGAWEKAHKDTKDSIDAMNRDVDTGLTKTEDVVKSHVPRLAGAASQISLAIAEARASGDTGGELAGLRRQEAGHVAFIARQEALPQTAKRVQNLIKANNELAAIRSQIESIIQGQRDETKEAADRVTKAADDRDANFIRMIQAGQQRREGAVTAAQADEALGNDIRANIALRNWLRRAIADVRARIQQARAAGRATEALAAELADLRRSRNLVRREIERLQEDAKQQASETRVESAQLDLQILETRVGDDPNAKQTNALIRAHQRVIAALKRAQKLAKGRKLEVKRLQLEIEQELAAIRDLRNAQKAGASGDINGALRQQFEFLQTMQGFSTNLLGNLIPGFATGGLVGGSATNTSTGGRSPMNLAVPGPTAGTRPTAGTSLKPVSAGQGNTQIALLREIRNILRNEHSGDQHPEVRHHRHRAATTGDYSYQGTHGM